MKTKRRFGSETFASIMAVALVCLFSGCSGGGGGAGAIEYPSTPLDPPPAQVGVPPPSGGETGDSGNREDSENEAGSNEAILDDTPPDDATANCSEEDSLVLPECGARLPDDLPPDPVNTAPPADRTVAVNFYGAGSFLQTADNPIQRGSEPGAIDEISAAVIRGRVTMRNGRPLYGVTITIPRHPEYGSTESRLDGLFDLMVNGGGADLVLRYEREGYLPIERRVSAPALDFSWVDDVVMTPVDGNTSAIDLVAPGAIQAAVGSEIVDKDGTRRGVVLFPRGITAIMNLPDGSQEALNNMTVRITEFTVGDTGPSAMPGLLPPASAYTYAAALTVDEAVSAGAGRVSFDRPVVFYLENFPGFPVGFPIPLGYYDTDKAAWIAGDNGIVIKITDIANGQAIITLNENETPASVEALAGLEVTTEELYSLGRRYSAGQTLWRMPIPHFTSWDANVGLWPPDDAVYASVAEPKKVGAVIDDPCYVSGSIIGCEDQTLGEIIGIVGSDFGLYHVSARAAGRGASNALDIPVSGEELPPSLKGIELEIEVAGQRKTESLDPLPNQTYRYIWDGKDGYGRVVQGVWPITVRIGYVYGAVYQRVPRFGYNGNGLVTMSPARTDITLRTKWKGSIGSWQNGSAGLGGWSLGVHHAYDPQGKTLYLGDGRQRSAVRLNDVITTIAGGGRQNPNLGGRALDMHFDNTRPLDSVTVDGAENAYLISSWGQTVWKTTPDGEISKFAGNPSRYIGNYQQGFGGDGGPAVLALLSFPQDATVDADGNVYIADTGNNRIRKVDTNGIITTIAGIGTVSCASGCPGGYSGDGGPAAEAAFSAPTDLGLDREGNIYIIDQTRERGSDIGSWPVIRRIGLDGIIQTVAGGEAADYGYDGAHPARDVRLCDPRGIDVDAAGNIFIAERICNRVRRISPEGRIEVVAGGGEDAEGENIPATDALLHGPIDVKADNEGNLFVAENAGYRIRRVAGDRTIVTIGGTGMLMPYTGDGGLAINANLSLHGLDMDEMGNIYALDQMNERLLKIGSMFPGVSHGDYVVASEDGREVYHFDRFGRHMDTKDALTGSTLYTFGYNDNGLLQEIESADGNVTAIRRDAGGAPTAIVTPFGRQTALSVDENGYLNSVTNPLGGEYRMEYFSDGLLSRFIDPNGHASAFAYDGMGLLMRDTDAVGGFKTLSRTVSETGTAVAVSTASGRSELYYMERRPTGAVRREVTNGAGLKITTEKDAGGNSVVTYPDGTVVAEETAPDPRFGMQAPIVKNSSTTTPQGLVSAFGMSRTASLADPEDRLHLARQTDVLTLNGREYHSEFTATSDSGLITNTAPTGRTSSATIDAMGRVVENRVAGLEGIAFSYDNAGRPVSISQGARSLSFAYNANGFLSVITDTAGRDTYFAYDGAGRVITKTLPDNREVNFDYDAGGNLISVTPPGRGAHLLGYNAVNMESLYNPPNAGLSDDRTYYTYNLDRDLVRITRPDGRLADFSYDTAGRLAAITSPGKNVSFTYDAVTGNPSAISDSDGGDIAYTYDGPLLLTEAWQGAVAGTVSRTYDNNFWVTETQVNGAHASAFIYDNDGLVHAAGNLVILRDSANGLVTGTTLGGVATSKTYNEYGEASSESAERGVSAIYSAVLTRDLLGRITGKTETIDGAQRLYGYAYDLAGRLVSDSSDGQVTAYTYDANGNRLSKEDANGRAEGAYDAQDRLISYGDNIYTYTANGELLTKTSPDGTTSYGYDALGNLRAVTLPDGTGIEYIIDGANRRIGKKVNGTIEKGWLYVNGLNPIAELDASGGVVSTFVYATKPNVPDYMARSGITYRILSDHLGSPRLIVNSSTGEVAQRMDYDEFGIVTTDTNPGFQPFGFAGGLYDSQTKLVRFGARDYDAEVGRWLSKDPIGFNGGDTNLYGYVMGDPVNFVDSSGLLAFFWHAGITYVAARNSGYGVRESVNLAWDVMQEDRSAFSHDPNFTTTHAMGGDLGERYQTPPETIAATNAYINNISNPMSGRIHAIQDLSVHAGESMETYSFFSQHTLRDITGGGTIGRAYQNTLNILNHGCGK